MHSEGTAEAGTNGSAGGFAKRDRWPETNDVAVCSESENFWVIAL